MICPKVGLYCVTRTNTEKYLVKALIEHKLKVFYDKFGLKNALIKQAIMKIENHKLLLSSMILFNQNLKDGFSFFQNKQCITGNWSTNRCAMGEKTKWHTLLSTLSKGLFPMYRAPSTCKRGISRGKLKGVIIATCKCVPHKILAIQKSNAWDNIWYTW